MISSDISDRFLDLQGSIPGAIAGSPGLGLDTWSMSARFSTEDGAIFWMAPGDGPTGPVVTLMQVTVPSGSTGTASGVILGQCMGNSGSGPMAGTSATCDAGTYQDHVSWGYGPTSSNPFGGDAAAPGPEPL